MATRLIVVTSTAVGLWVWWRRRRKSAPLTHGLVMRRARALGKRFLEQELLRSVMSPLPGQLGGLAHAETATMMIVPGHRWGRFVLKPVQPGTRGLREVAFYEYASNKPKLNAFLCAYHGVVKPDRSYIVLDDVTAGMARPCTLDLKLGVKTYEEDAPLDKKQREAAKYPPQAVLGCRIVGMRVWDDETVCLYDKHWGYSLKDANDLARGLEIYLRDATPEALRRCLDRLADLKAWLDEPNDLVFISSSLLFVYDADRPDDVDVRLIDFAHVRRDAQRDRGCITGLDTVLSVLDKLAVRPNVTTKLKTTVQASSPVKRPCPEVIAVTRGQRTTTLLSTTPPPPETRPRSRGASTASPPPPAAPVVACW